MKLQFQLILDYFQMSQKQIQKIPDNIKMYIQQQSKVHGKKSKQRHLQPSMKQLLQWNDTQNLKQDYKKNTISPNPLYQYESKIKKSSSPWITEKQQNYQKFNKYNQTTLICPVDLKTFNSIRKRQQQKNPIVITNQDPNNKQYYSDPKGKSITISDYAIKKIKSQQDLKNILEYNNTKKTFHHRQFENILYLNSEGDIPQQLLEQNKQRKNNKSAQKATEPIKVDKKKKKLSNKVVIIDPSKQSPQLKKRLQKIKKFHQTTRWIPNTSFTTYYGKPAFQNYGRANTKPTTGGIVYGQYLLSHNVNPHRGNKPKYIQSYLKALAEGENLGTIYPQPPRLRDQEDIANEEIQFKKKMNPIYAKENFIKQLKIQSPDLINSYVFSQNPNKLVTKIPIPKMTTITNKKPKELVPYQKQKSQTLKRKQKQIPIKNKQSQPHQKKQIKSKQKQNKQIYKKKEKSKSPKDIKPDQKALTFFSQRPINFYDQILRKKQKANRLALKVTEVICKAKQIDHETKYDKIIIQNNENLDQIHLNPQNYKNVPSVWLQRIPSAGKPSPKHQTIKDILF